MMVVISLSTVTRLARPRSSSFTLSSFTPVSSTSDLPAVRMAISSSSDLRRSPKPGALTAQTASVPRSLFTTKVASASPSTSSATIRSGWPERAICSSNGRMSFMLRDLLLVDQNIGIFEHHFHPLGVGDEIRRKIAAVELHAFHGDQLRHHGLRFFHRDDAVFAHLLHRVGNDVSDGFIAVG